MNLNSSTNLLTFDSPARYQIRVIGRISRSWLDRLEGMKIEVEIPTEESVICALEGELLDQGALIGVLNWLYELHLPVLSVECLSCLPGSRSSIEKVKRNSSQ